VGLSVRASPIQRLAPERSSPASGVRTGSVRSASREDTVAPSPAATIHASRAAPGQTPVRSTRTANHDRAGSATPPRRNPLRKWYAPSQHFSGREKTRVQKKCAQVASVVRPSPAACRSWSSGLSGPHLPLARRGPGRFARALRQTAPLRVAASRVRFALMARRVAAVLADRPRCGSRLSLPPLAAQSRRRCVLSRDSKAKPTRAPLNQKHKRGPRSSSAQARAYAGRLFRI
jgi:hypothetical protein